jgi:hypothetical protein
VGLRCLNAWTTLIILYIYIFVKGRSTGNPHRIRSKNVCTAIVHHQPLQNLMLIEPLFFPWLGSRVCEIRVSLSHSSGLSPYITSLRPQNPLTLRRKSDIRQFDPHLFIPFCRRKSICIKLLITIFGYISHYISIVMNLLHSYWCYPRYSP